MRRRGELLFFPTVFWEKCVEEVNYCFFQLLLERNASKRLKTAFLGVRFRGYENVQKLQLSKKMDWDIILGFIFVILAILLV